MSAEDFQRRFAAGMEALNAARAEAAAALAQVAGVEGEKGALQATIEDMGAELAQFEVRPHSGRPRSEDVCFKFL